MSLGGGWQIRRRVHVQFHVGPASGKVDNVQSCRRRARCQGSRYSWLRDLPPTWRCNRTPRCPGRPGSYCKAARQMDRFWDRASRARPAPPPRWPLGVRDPARLNWRSSRRKREGHCGWGELDATGRQQHDDGKGGRQRSGAVRSRPASGHVVRHDTPPARRAGETLRARVLILPTISIQSSTSSRKRHRPACRCTSPGLPGAGS